MVHAGGDNHSDHPLPLGGGGEAFRLWGDQVITRR